MKKQQICILGSTGSIGTQALDVVRQHSDRYEIYCLTAHRQVELLAQQAREFQPAAVVIADETRYEALKALLADAPDIKVYAGTAALEQIVTADPIDMVLAAMVGFAGLLPTINAIKARKKICLANKETLVVAGQLICDLARQHHVPILPEPCGRCRCEHREDPAHVLGRALSPLHPRATATRHRCRRPETSHLEHGR